MAIKRKGGARIICGSTNHIYPLYDPNWGRKKLSKKEKIIRNYLKNMSKKNQAGLS